MNYTRTFVFTAALQNDLETIKMACQEVSTSTKLQELLHLVFELGRFINHGSHRAKVTGVRVSTLPKLAQMRTNQPAGKQTPTLLHFIVRFIRRRGREELLTLAQDLKQCKRAARNCWQ